MKPLFSIEQLFLSELKDWAQKGGGNMTKRKQAGFTLIELLVVIGILAVLLAIVLVAINPDRQFKQANDTQRSSNVNAILNAVTQYGADHRGDLSGLAVAPATTLPATATPLDSAFSALCTALTPTYIAALPVDPTTGTAVVDCATPGWDTGYTIMQSATGGRITVAATAQIPENAPITVTR